MKNLLVGLLFWGLGAGAVFGDVLPVELEEIQHHRAELVVVGRSGETRYTAADLEEIGAYRMSTITPWREDITAFDGARLSDVLAANGLSDARAIRVIAENGYATEIPSEVWTSHEILLATRVDGKPHSRRARGPIQFVLPMSDEPEVAEAGMGQYWVWMAARIEPVE